MEQREPTSSNKKVPVEFFIRLCFKKYKNTVLAKFQNLHEANEKHF